jgi:hypothetical protein
MDAMMTYKVLKNCEGNSQIKIKVGIYRVVIAGFTCILTKHKIKNFMVSKFILCLFVPDAE